MNEILQKFATEKKVGDFSVLTDEYIIAFTSEEGIWSRSVGIAKSATLSRYLTGEVAQKRERRTIA